MSVRIVWMNRLLWAGRVGPLWEDRMGMDLDRSWEFREVKAPRLQDIRQLKVVRSSALLTGRLYSFLLEVESTPGP